MELAALHQLGDDEDGLEGPQGAASDRLPLMRWNKDAAVL